MPGYGSFAAPSERRAAARQMPTVAMAAAALAVIALGGVALVAFSRGPATSVSCGSGFRRRAVRERVCYCGRGWGCLCSVKCA